MNDGIFVVIPAFEEERVIERVVRRLLDGGYTVVVVDDGSSDQMGEIVSRLPVHLLRHPVNLGQGAALQTGMTYALDRGADIVVHFDADEQHRVEDIGPLVDPILRGEADVVLGSRFLREGDTQAIPFGRRTLLRCAVVINLLLTGMRLTDAHNGLRALSREAASRIHLRENRFAHASEIVDQIRRAGLRCLERPSSVVYSEYSRLKGQSAWNGFRILIDLVLRRVFR